MHRQFLRGGTVLWHDDQDNVHILRDTDIIIDGDLIEGIGKNLRLDSNSEIIDCKDKIISPGFFSTHQHVWQTQLKGRHADDTLLDYYPKGNMQCYNYTADDVYWGELAGCLESIDAGTTYVVDHAHMTYSQDHALAGVSAAIDSGIRSSFCYSLIPRFSKWDSKVEMADPLVPDWFFPQLRELAGKQPFGKGRVQIGFGFDNFELPKDQVIDIFNQARSAGVKLITSHWCRNNLGGASSSVPDMLHSYGLLKSDIILSHANGSTNEEFQLLKSSDVYTSSSPGTEAHMGHGDVVGFRDDVLGSFGADCHSNNSASILDAMQTALALARSQRSSQILSTGKFPRSMEPTIQQAFNLATINGARAAGVSDITGSLAVGKKADIVIFNGTTPAMLCAADQDPLAAVVRHAGTREVETVIIGGIIRKLNGELQAVQPSNDVGWNGFSKINAITDEEGSLAWNGIVKKLMKSRDEIEARIVNSSNQPAREAFLGAMGVTEDILV